MKKLVPIIGGVVIILSVVGLLTLSKKDASTPSNSTVLKNISSEEVSEHATKENCWTIVGSGVYDITAYVPRHPGGVAEITRICGVDGTKLFEGNPEHTAESKSQLNKLQIGNLAS